MYTNSTLISSDSGLRILVTGSEGFVGKATCELLRKEGHFVYGYDVMNGQDDIRDIRRLTKVVKENKINRILHLAAIARFSEADTNPKLAFETNVDGTGIVANVARRFNIPLVYASTGSVYMPIKEEPPIKETFAACGNSVYGVSKFIGEEYVREHTPHIILRYAHLYGREKRGHGLIGGFLARIERGLAPTLYGGTQSNDFTYINDVARANLLALTASWDKWNQIYNIGTGEELSAEKAGEIVCEAYGYKGEIEKKEGRTVDPGRFVYDISKARDLLGFKAEYDFKAGLSDMFGNNTDVPKQKGDKNAVKG